MFTDEKGGCVCASAQVYALVVVSLVVVYIDAVKQMYVSHLFLIMQEVWLHSGRTKR